MNKALRLVVFGFGLLVLASLLIGSFMPGTWSVERARSMRAAPEVVAAELQSLRAWPEWTYWSREIDPMIVITFEGPERGAGARMSWRSDRIGNGSLTLTEVTPDGGIRYDVAFQGADELAHGQVGLAAEPGGTRVVWKEWGELTHNPIHRLFSFLIELRNASVREKVLEELARRVESR